MPRWGGRRKVELPSANQIRVDDGRHSVISRISTPSIPLSLLIASHCCPSLPSSYSSCSMYLDYVQTYPRCPLKADIRHPYMSGYSGNIWQRRPFQESSLLHQASGSLDFASCMFFYMMQLFHFLSHIERLGSSARFLWSFWYVQTLVPCKHLQIFPWKSRNVAQRSTS